MSNHTGDNVNDDQSHNTLLKPKRSFWPRLTKPNGDTKSTETIYSSIHEEHLTQKQTKSHLQRTSCQLRHRIASYFKKQFSIKTEYKEDAVVQSWADLRVPMRQQNI